ncbi:hypothetical protein [Methylobacterium sp. CM6246]
MRAVIGSSTLFDEGVSIPSLIVRPDSRIVTKGSKHEPGTARPQLMARFVPTRTSGIRHPATEIKVSSQSAFMPYSRLGTDHPRSIDMIPG